MDDGNIKYGPFGGSFGGPDLGPEVEVDEPAPQAEQAEVPEVRYRAKPKGNWVQIEPMPPKDIPKSGGGIFMPGSGARRRSEQAQEDEHTKFKMTHARVLSVGPDVTRVKVGDVIRFVGHPQCQMTGEALQECIINGEFVDFLPETLIYAVLEPIAPDLKVLQ